MRRLIPAMFVREWIDFCLALAVAGGLGSMALGDETNAWSRFRGPNGTGASVAIELPDAFAKDRIVWKQDVAAGQSSPIAIGNSLFITTHEGKSRNLVCLDATTGETMWTQGIESVRSEAATQPNGPATCTPVCNDRYIAAFFPDAGLVVYSLEGKQVWTKDIGPFYSMHGISASPILVDNALVMAIDQLSESYIVAFDIETGEEKWRTDRLVGVTGGYSTPVLVTLESRSLIISATPGEMVAYDAKSGEKVMSVVGLTNAPVSVPAVAGNRIYFSEPPGQPIPMEALGNADKNKDGVIEIAEVENSLGAKRLIERLDKGFGNGDGKVDQQEWDKGFGTFLNRGGLSCVEIAEKDGQVDGQVAWKYTKTTPYIPSVLTLDGLVYIINDGGILMCFDGDSGELVKRERIGAATGGYYASPVAAGDRIVLANTEGKVTLVRSGREFKILGTLDLEDAIIATPSIHGGRLYVRTETALYCFG